MDNQLGLDLDPPAVMDVDDLKRALATVVFYGTIEALGKVNRGKEYREFFEKYRNASYDELADAVPNYVECSVDLHLREIGK